MDASADGNVWYSIISRPPGADSLGRPPTAKADRPCSRLDVLPPSVLIGTVWGMHICVDQM